MARAALAPGGGGSAGPLSDLEGFSGATADVFNPNPTPTPTPTPTPNLDPDPDRDPDPNPNQATERSLATAEGAKAEAEQLAKRQVSAHLSTLTFQPFG